MTYIEIQQKGDSFDVFYNVDASELCEGSREHIGELRRFMRGYWKFWPIQHSAAAWSLSLGDLDTIRNKIVELEAIPDPQYVRPPPVYGPSLPRARTRHLP